MAGKTHPELDEKYEKVKEAVRGGAKVLHALSQFNLDHGSYYGRRQKDPDRVKKTAKTWSRKPKAESEKKKARKTSFIIPLESNTATTQRTAPTEKIAVIICDSTNIKNVLEGLK